MIGATKEVKPEKHGNYVTSFKLSENIFVKGATFDKATKAKIVVSQVVFWNYLNMLNSDGYVFHATR